MEIVAVPLTHFFIFLYIGIIRNIFQYKVRESFLVRMLVKDDSAKRKYCLILYDYYLI